MANNTMKRNPAAGTLKVYWFTLRQMVLAKGWLISTFLIAGMLLLGIPLLLFTISEYSGGAKHQSKKTEIGVVCVVDETEGEADYSVLSREKDHVEYLSSPSMDHAISATAGRNNAVILRVTKPEQSYILTVYLPQVTEISRFKASSYGAEAEARFGAVLMQKAELTPEGVALLSMPVMTETAAVSGDAEEADNSTIVEVIRMIVPFLIMMMIYMMVVIYGQSMSNSVMLEKTSKLMETILTAVHPVALMTGKLFATATAAVMQLMIWLFSAIGGTIGGALFAIRMIPDTNNEAVIMITDVSRQAESISVAGVLLSIVFMALGFLLYLSLSAVAGAMASKPEDLNKTNVIYVLIIVGSMLLCLNNPAEAAVAAENNANVPLISEAFWLKCFPFTAILVMPAELILGNAAAGITIGSIACLFGTVVLMLIFAAVVYKLLVLYRGEPPKFRQLRAMLKEEKQRTQKNTQNN